MTFGAASAAATAVGGSAAPRVRGGVWRFGGGALARHRTVYVAKLVALILMYSGAAHLSYWLEFAGPVAAIVWLPVGVGVAFLYLGGLGLFPGVLIGDLLVNDYSALSTPSAVGQSVGNLLEVVVAVVLIRVLVAAARRSTRSWVRRAYCSRSPPVLRSAQPSARRRCGWETS